jgi:hypothetical protein
MNYLPPLASNHGPLDFLILSRQDYRREPPSPGTLYGFYNGPVFTNRNIFHFSALIFISGRMLSYYA